MALINTRFKVTVTDDLSTDPVITQEVNYTNSNNDNHVTKTITADSSGDGDITNNTPVEIISEATDAKYVVIQSTIKCRLYLNLDSAPDVSIATEDLSASFMVLDGDINKIWAVNTDTGGTAAYIKVVYVY